jgi:hypothetical protein
MQSGHKRSADDDGESAEAAARPGALQAQEAPSVRGGDISNKKAEDIFKRVSAANEQFDDDTVTEDAYNVAISEMRTEFVRDVVVFMARVFDRSLKEICHHRHVYGEDGVKELKRKAVEAECECTFHTLSDDEKGEWFNHCICEEEEDRACGSSDAIPSPNRSRHVQIAFGATGEKRERNITSALSDADLIGAIRRASEKVLGRPDGYAIAIADSISHTLPEQIYKMDTGEQVYAHFERIMHQQVYDYRHNRNYR